MSLLECETVYGLGRLLKDRSNLAASVCKSKREIGEVGAKNVDKNNNIIMKDEAPLS